MVEAASLPREPATPLAEMPISAVRWPMVAALSLVNLPPYCY